MKLVKTAVAAALLGTVFCVSAAEVHVAVAANFYGSGQGTGSDF